MERGERVSEGSLSAIRAELADHHSHGPERYRDEQWDCYLMSTGGESAEKWTAWTWPNSPAADVASPRNLGSGVECRRLTLMEE